VTVVAFPTSQPEGTALAHVELGAGIGGALAWSIQTLNAGPPTVAPKDY